MNIERELASIKRIETINPIENADAIVMVTFHDSNWVCVMKKEEAIVGNLVVYFEVDSVLPSDDPRFAFLAEKKFRIKTIRLRGQISQGLAAPISIFPELTDVKEYQDVTNDLRVVKYEPPETISLSGDTKGDFPGFLEKTDETRLQNYKQSELEEVLSEELTATLKVDGTSATYYLYEGEFGVCSRNQELKDTEDNTYWKIARKYNIEQRLRLHAKAHPDQKYICIQGEIAGPGIQGNRGKYSEVQLFVFNIIDIVDYKLKTYKQQTTLLEELNTIAEGAPLQQVKFLFRSPTRYFKDFDAIQSFVEGPEANAGGNIEGMVFRTDNGRSFKVLNRKYLLKHGE